jgi:hypothetical protein
MSGECSISAETATTRPVVGISISGSLMPPRSLFILIFADQDALPIGSTVSKE